MKKFTIAFALILSACGGGGDDATPQPAETQQPVLHIPENGICQTTVPIPYDCIVHGK